MYDCRHLQEAQRDLAPWISKVAEQYPKLVDRVEGNIAETLTFYRLPRAYHKHLKSTSLLERLNEEIRRRTRIVRIFPNDASCLRLIRVLCSETHETWLEDSRDLNMALAGRAEKGLLAHCYLRNQESAQVSYDEPPCSTGVIPRERFSRLADCRLTRSAEPVESRYARWQ